DQLTGFGQWEYEFKGNRAESQGSSKDKTRLAFAGLKFGDYGSIDYGRNYGVAYDIGAWTDVLPEFGGDTWTQTDVFMTGRTTGVAGSYTSLRAPEPRHDIVCRLLVEAKNGSQDTT
ncbi:porin, partial [Shigella sonnei]|uniref:porin n=1 Tax=Shigella sonnei TaxID=624 RepID=UPI0020940267